MDGLILIKQFTTEKISPGGQLKNDSFLSQTVFCQDSGEIRKMGSDLASACLCSIVKLLAIPYNIFILNFMSL